MLPFGTNLRGGGLTCRNRYLLIDFHIAELRQRLSHPDRKLVLKEAREAYERFLNLLDSYRILSPSNQRLYNTYTESPTTFSTIQTSDPGARRDAKIANFKQEKELKNKLQVGSVVPYIC
jgi:hypothetical protein